LGNLVYPKSCNNTKGFSRSIDEQLIYTQPTNVKLITIGYIHSFRLWKRSPYSLNKG
jgi:hypothetical protein